MEPFRVFIESGKKRAFAGALDWPGWSRGSASEDLVLQSLLEYAPRYALVLQPAGIDFPLPASSQDFTIVERLAGDVSTDFGAPAAFLEVDRVPLQPEELHRSQSILTACWEAFARAADQAVGRELQKGPRGGGRDLDRMIAHVLDAECAYLRRLAWKHSRQPEQGFPNELARIQQAARAALDSAVYQGLPESGPRGGRLWTPRYYTRRSAWHILDHAWEIQDRLVS